MDTKKQNVKESKGTAALITSNASGNEASRSSKQGASANQGGSPKQGATASMAHGRDASGIETSTSSKQGAAASMAHGSDARGDEASTSSKHVASANQGAKLGQGTNDQNRGEPDLLQHAKQATDDIVNQVQQRAGSQLTRQKENAATDLSNVVNAVRRFGESLASEESGPIARYAAEYGDKAANSLERLSNYVRERDPKQLLGDVQDFGRRRPALLIGGALLLGFAGARLIKSSMDQASQQSLNPNGQAARPGTHNV